MNLSSDILDLGLDSYNVYRKDRTHLTRGKKLFNQWHSGGVLIYSRLNLSRDCLFVTVKVSGFSFLFCGCLNPSAATSIYSGFCDLAEEAVSMCDVNTNIVLTGDFNLPDTEWSHDASSIYLSGFSVPNQPGLFFLQLQQINQILNSQSVLMDLVFTDSSTNVSSGINILHPLENNHQALSISGCLRCPLQGRNLLCLYFQ